MHADALLTILKAAGGPLTLKQIDALAVHASFDPVRFPNHFLPMSVDGAGPGRLRFCHCCSLGI